MNRYRYRATNASGETEAASIDAATASEAIVKLEEQGLVVESIEIVPPEKVAADAELAAFYGELQGLLDRRHDWLPRIQAIVAELPRGVTKRRLMKRLVAIERVTTPQEFVENRDAIDLLPLIATPLQSHAAIRSRSEWMATQSTMLESRARYVNAFAYPVVLFFCVISVFVLLSIFVVQGIRSFFCAAQLRVPRVTHSLFWLADQICNHPARTLCFFLLGSVVIFFAIRWWRHLALTNTLLGRFVAGTTSNLLAMSELISMLALLLELKSPLGLALSIAGRQCKHAYYRRAADGLAMNAQAGVVSEFPRQATKRLPPLLLHALKSGDASSPHLPLLHELSAIYRDRARLRRDWIVSSGPSIAVFVVGLIVLWLVGGLLWPMFIINRSLS